MENGWCETVARAIHERWRVEQRAAGSEAPSWSELDESRRESSRDQARGIPAKLHGIGCEFGSLSDGGEEEFGFTAAELETLSIAEHDRWVAERRRAGWTLGDKDPGRRTTPYLVPFDDLPPEIAEYDRMFVREIPALLASAGLRVVRVNPD